MPVCRIKVVFSHGFIISTSEGNIVYTGDLRRHGPRKDSTEDFIEKAKAPEPIAMICEGTRMATTVKRQNISEPEVKKQAQELIASTDKMVFAAHYSRDISRTIIFSKNLRLFSFPDGFCFPGP